MTRPAGGGTVVTPNPWVWESTDFRDFVIRMTVAWNPGSRAITGITLYRDADCEFTQMLIGLGPGNNPNKSDKVIDVPDGTTVVPQNRINQLASRGVGTIDQLQTLNITAGTP